MNLGNSSITNTLSTISYLLVGVIALTCYHNAQAQVNNLYFSLDLGSKYDLYQVSNYAGDNEFNQKPWYAFPALGLSVGAEINDFSLETGVDFHQYAYVIHGRNWGSASTGFWTIQIPFRFKYDILNNSTRWDWNVGVSYNLGFILGSSNGLLGAEDRATFSSSSSTSVNGIVIDSSSSGLLGSFDDQNKTYHLIGFRTEIEYDFDFGLGIFVGANKLTGFRKITEVDAVFQRNTESIDRARYTSNGDYFKVFFGLRYSFVTRNRTR